MGLFEALLFFLHIWTLKNTGLNPSDPARRPIDKRRLILGVVCGYLIFNIARDSAMYIEMHCLHVYYTSTGIRAML